MTRYLVPFTLCILTVFSSMGNSARAGSPEYSKPPYWMPTYDEHVDWEEDQRKLYVDRFTEEAKEIPELALLKKEQVEEAFLWVDGWKDLMKKVYRYCDQKENAKTCKKIAQIRSDALQLRSVAGFLEDESVNSEPEQSSAKSAEPQP